MLEIIKTSPTIHMYDLPSRMGFTSCPMMAGGLSHEAAKEVAASVGHVDGVVPVVGRAEAPRTETVRSVDRIAVEPGDGLGVPVGEGGSQAHTGKQKQGQ